MYHLIDQNGKLYDSEEPGILGGHKKLKIYGRLDCPSAARYIAKGQYVKHCVFFKDEETAIAAGCRLCVVCMPGRKWNRTGIKSNNSCMKKPRENTSKVKAIWNDNKK